MCLGGGVLLLILLSTGHCLKNKYVFTLMSASLVIFSHRDLLLYSMRCPSGDPQVSSRSPVGHLVVIARSSSGDPRVTEWKSSGDFPFIVVGGSLFGHPRESQCRPIGERPFSVQPRAFFFANWIKNSGRSATGLPKDSDRPPLGGHRPKGEFSTQWKPADLWPFSKCRVLLEGRKSSRDHPRVDFAELGR